jgi:hypothetical protein
MEATDGVSRKLTLALGSFPHAFVTGATRAGQNAQVDPDPNSF